MECYLKKIKVKGDTIVAICDKDLLGKNLREGKLRLNISKNFYGGSLVTINDAIEEIKNSSIANIVGNKITEEVIKVGLAHEEGIIRVSGVAHAQIIKV